MNQGQTCRHKAQDQLPKALGSYDAMEEVYFLCSNATGLKEKLAPGRAIVLGRAHVPAGREALLVSRSGCPLR